MSFSRKYYIIRGIFCRTCSSGARAQKYGTKPVNDCSIVQYSFHVTYHTGVFFEDDWQRFAAPAMVDLVDCVVPGIHNPRRKATESKSTGVAGALPYADA